MFIPFSFCLIHLIAWMPADEEHASSSDRNGRAISRSDCQPSSRPRLPFRLLRHATSLKTLTHLHLIGQPLARIMLYPMFNSRMDFWFSIYTKTNTWADTIYNAQTYQDVRVDAQVEVRAGNDGAVGIVCRYSPTNGWYEFNIYADQTYVIMYGQWLSPGIARYMPLHITGSEKIKTGANQIGLVCQGDALTPYINNVRMITYEDNKVGLKDGNVGLTASSFSDVPFVAAFDWVKVGATPPVTP